MNVSIDKAAAEFKESVDKFVEHYKAKHAENPEQYPMELSPENAGLWWEWITEFHLERER